MNKTYLRFTIAVLSILAAACSVAPERRPIIIADVISRRAAFDLACEATSIRVAEIGVKTYGAEGCGKRATYLLEDALGFPGNCDFNFGVTEDNFRAYCRAIMNSAASGEKGSTAR